MAEQSGMTVQSGMCTAALMAVNKLYCWMWVVHDKRHDVGKHVSRNFDGKRLLFQRFSQEDMTCNGVRLPHNHELLLRASGLAVISLLLWKMNPNLMFCFVFFQ